MTRRVDTLGATAASSSTPTRPRAQVRARGWRARFAAASLTLCALSALSPATAQAEDDGGPLDNAPPVMRQTLWREGRFELTPKFGFTLGDAYEHNILPGVLLQYYPLDWLGVGLDLAYGFSVDTDLHERIDSELDNKRDAICPPGALQGAAYEECLAKLGVTDSIGTTSLQTLVTAQVAFIPIRGKMMWFGDLLVHYDTQIAVGAALGILRGEGMDGGFAVGPSVAVTGRLLFNDWLGFSLEVRDFLLDYHEATDQTGTDLPSKFHNHVMISFGLSLNFPQVPRVEEIE